MITRILDRLPRLGAAAFLSLLCLAAASCRGGIPQPTADSPLPTSAVQAVTPAASPTPFQPSPTPQPLAARVNGEVVTLEQFNAELARFQAAVGTQLATEDSQRVLQDLIDRLLLSQAARETGFTADEQAVQQRMDELVDRLGGEGALVKWMASQGYTEQDFRRDLAASMEAAWMRDRIAAGVSSTAEQVHARQVRLASAEEAASVQARLQAGEDFAAIAAEYDPVGRGDLGWFPRGYLMEDRLSEAAFGLQPGETSEVIETESGFHILQVIERDPAHPLDPDARLALQVRALNDWLAERRSQSDIQVLLP